MTYDRRGFLSLTGTAVGALWLAAKPELVGASLARAAAARRADAADLPPPPYEVLTPEQATELEAIAGRILPTDDLPGAREARVIHFLDHGLATWAADQRAATLDGLAHFTESLRQRYPDVQSFSQLPTVRQDEFLRANQDGDFFQSMLFFTQAGVFSHPDWGGNYDKAGWRILGFDDRYAWQPPFGWYDAKENGGPN